MAVSRPPTMRQATGVGRLEIIEMADHTPVLVHRVSHRRELLIIAMVLAVAILVTLVFIVMSSPAGSDSERQYTISPVQPY